MAENFEIFDFELDDSETLKASDSDEAVTDEMQEVSMLPFSNFILVLF